MYTNSVGDKLIVWDLKKAEKNLQDHSVSNGIMKMKKSKVIDPDNPPLTDAQLREFRPVSPERQAMFRRAYVHTFKKEPPVMGRPPKDASEKYRDVHIRLHPQAFAWAKHEAKRRGIGYQTVINEALLKRAA